MPDPPSSGMPDLVQYKGEKTFATHHESKSEGYLIALAAKVPQESKSYPIIRVYYGLLHPDARCRALILLSKRNRSNVWHTGEKHSN
jgi:hypothetical protein